ncbi:MAG: aldo/keto reductase [Candidatus Omnitrophota bacterium]
MKSPETAFLSRRLMNDKNRGMSLRSRLVLGSAQLGMPYGIKNRTGQPFLEEAISIVEEAWRGGIVEFDTAQDYGTSEAVLGQIFSALGITEQAYVISKISTSCEAGNTEKLDLALQRSLKYLGVKKLGGLLLHDERQLDFWPRGLRQWFLSCRNNGLIKNAGISVYSPSRALVALATEGIDLVQIPSNILDRRFDAAGVFKMAEDQGKTVYVRSVFLQGALLMSLGELPDRVNFLRDTVEKVQVMAKDLGRSVEELCLGYVMRKWPSAKIVLGAETADQIRFNIRLAGQDYSSLPIRQIEEGLGNAEERIVNIAQWPQKI